MSVRYAFSMIMNYIKYEILALIKKYLAKWLGYAKIINGIFCTSNVHELRCNTHTADSPSRALRYS